MEGVGPCDLDLAAELGRLVVRDTRVRLRLRNEVGEIEAHDLTDVVLEARSEVGAIHLREVDGQMLLTTETGNITGRALAGLVTAHTG